MIDITVNDVPTSSPISFSQNIFFCLDQSFGTPDPVKCEIDLLPNGAISVGGTVSGLSNETWATGTFTASDYEIRYTQTSGGLDGSITPGTWVSLGSAVEVFVQQSGSGVKTTQGLLEIREVATGTILTSASVDFTAEITV